VIDRQPGDQMMDDTMPKNSPQLAGTAVVTNSNEGLKPKDIWDKVDVVGKLLGAILIPFALAAAGFYVNLTLQDRAAKEKTVEIAITVLQQSNSTALPELRGWALGVFEDTVLAANQELPDAAKKELKTLPLPGAGRLNWSGLANGTPCGSFPGIVVENGECIFKSPP
jgi:hypothetical protein